MEGLSVLVLAAGEGKRMCSGYPKVLHPLCGHPMLYYILESALAFTGQIHVVIGHGAPQVRETMGSSWNYILQEKQLGTGHPVAGSVCPIPVVCWFFAGDTPLLKQTSAKERPISGGATVMTAQVPDLRVTGNCRDPQGQVEAIVEEAMRSGAKAINESILGPTF